MGGGAIANISTGTLRVWNSTITGSSAEPDEGGGIRNRPGGVATLRNTIVAGNSAQINPDVAGSYTSQGYNLIGINNFTTGFTAPGDQVGTSASPLNPMLGPLQDNGGPTFTHALLPFSPAIDAGSCTDLEGDPVTTDQRGYLRPHGATYTFGSVPEAGCSTSDALSGVATAASLGLSGRPTGLVTATCSGAADQAGNAAAPVSVSYTGSEAPAPPNGFPFSGFFAPVENLPVLNRVNAGQAVPVKFSLGGDHGLDIFASGYPRSDAIAGNATDPVEAVTETVSAGGSSLSYDAASDTYTYVWKIERAWAGSCRELTLQFSDGTPQQARFNFTR